MFEIERELEKRLVLFLLKYSSKGKIGMHDLTKKIQMPKEKAHEILDSFQSRGFIEVDTREISVSPEDRLKLAILAVKLGSDIEGVCKLIDWKEFEDMTAYAFDLNNYRVLKRFRFSFDGRRREIDILALRNPNIVCVDCKRWRRSWSNTSIREAVKKQIERSKAIVKATPNLVKRMNLEKWEMFRAIPIIISLYPAPSKYYDGVPVVPILQLSDFIHNLPTQIETMTFFESKLKRNLDRFL